MLQCLYSFQICSVLNFISFNDNLYQSQKKCLTGQNMMLLIIHKIDVKNVIKNIVENKLKKLKKDIEKSINKKNKQKGISAISVRNICFYPIFTIVFNKNIFFFYYDREIEKSINKKMSKRESVRFIYWTFIFIPFLLQYLTKIFFSFIYDREI